MNLAYEQMTHEQRLATWVHYKNACELAVTTEARLNPDLAKRRNERVERLYQGWIRYYKLDDIN